MNKRVQGRKRAYVFILLTVICVSVIGFFLFFNLQNNDQVSTAEEALNIAKPLIEQYAEENNRTITSMEATLRDSSPPISSLGEIEADTSHRSHWDVEADFEPVNDVESGLQHWIYGYHVDVWADTGEIRYHEAQGSY